MKVTQIENIKIYIYGRDHRPPHIHARFNEYDVSILIESGEIMAGSFPAKKLKVVKQWLIENAEDALDLFYQLNPDLK